MCESYRLLRKWLEIKTVNATETLIKIKKWLVYVNMFHCNYPCIYFLFLAASTPFRGHKSQGFISELTMTCMECDSGLEACWEDCKVRACSLNLRFSSFPSVKVVLHLKPIQSLLVHNRPLVFVLNSPRPLLWHLRTENLELHVRRTFLVSHPGWSPLQTFIYFLHHFLPSHLSRVTVCLNVTTAHTL